MNNLIFALINQLLDGMGLMSSTQRNTAEHRLKTCFECPNRKSMTCGSCGCPVSRLALSPSPSCPLNKH